MKIRKFESKDIKKVVSLWHKVSRLSYGGISSDYGKFSEEIMEKIFLPTSEVYLFVEDRGIIGFVAIIEDSLVVILDN